MPMQCHSDQEVPMNSKIHNSLRFPNPPILQYIHHLPIEPPNCQCTGDTRADKSQTAADFRRQL